MAHPENMNSYAPSGVAGIDGPRHGPEADGSQKPNDAAAIPCAKAGSNGGVAAVADTNNKPVTGA
jgi:hypothetical protein